MGLSSGITFSLPTYLIGSFCAYLLYCIYWDVTVGQARRKLIADHGCKPVSRDNSDLLGINTFRRMTGNFKKHNLLETNLDRFNKFGKTFAMRNLGRDLILTIEPENLKTIQSLNFKKWSLGQTRKTAFNPLLGQGIFTTDGAAWQHSRDLLRPNFHRNQVGDRATFESHVNHLLDAIPTDGSTVDLQDLFFRLTMDSATEFLFGESTGTLKPGLSTVSHSKFAECFMRAQDIVGEWGRFNKLVILHRWRQLMDDVKFVHDFVDGYVEKGLQYRASLGSEKAVTDGESGGRYVFLHELVKQTDDKVQIRNELLNILLAGRDTTASLLSNAWFVLARRPDVWARLRAEVDELHGEEPTFQNIKDMKYLRAFLNESLRVHPVVPGNSRTAVEDTVLPRGGGPDGRSPILVKKNQIVAWSVYSMHRRRDFYGEDAEEFKPERWLGDKGLRPGWEYLPFNGGPRICIGQQFALTEASYCTIRLLQKFKKVEPRDEKPWTEWVTLTLASHNGCSVALTPA